MDKCILSSFNSDNIFAMSDIHGDFSALIINLRDLAKCIEYTQSKSPESKSPESKSKESKSSDQIFQHVNDWLDNEKKDLPDFLFDITKSLEYLKNPNTSYPNNQGSFANWLYKTPPTCKEGNGAQCIANIPSRINSNLITPGFIQ